MSDPRMKFNYVCHEHQCMADECGCFNPEDYCACGTRKTAQYDGFYCMLCAWSLEEDG